MDVERLAGRDLHDLVGALAEPPAPADLDAGR